MGGRQKGKHMKRSRSWHHRFTVPDRTFAAAVRRLDRALARAGQPGDRISADDEGTER